MVEFSNGDKSLFAVISPEDISLSNENVDPYWTRAFDWATNCKLDNQDLNTP